MCVGVDDTPLPKIQNLVPTFSRTAMICKKSIVQKIADQRNGRI